MRLWDAFFYFDRFAPQIKARFFQTKIQIFIEDIKI